MKHKHHIIPRHIGGTNDATNIVELTIEEHTDAHKILFERDGRLEDECAWKMLSGKTKEGEILRIELAKKGTKKYQLDPVRSSKWKLRISESLKGKTQSEESRKKRSKSLKLAYKEGRVNTKNLWKNPYKPTKQDHQKMAAARKKSRTWNDAVRSPETAEKKRLSSIKSVKIKIDDKTFNSIREAAKRTDFTYNQLLDIRHGRKSNDRVTFL